MRPCVCYVCTRLYSCVHQLLITFTVARFLLVSKFEDLTLKARYELSFG